MQSVDLANRTLHLANAEQTGLTFQGRNQSMPASQKKHKKPNYEGMTKDQIKQAKKEKRQRREWNKYKDKLLKERDEVTKQFHSSYYWNSFVPAASRRPSQHLAQQQSNLTSPKITRTSNMNNQSMNYGNQQQV